MVTRAAEPPYQDLGVEHGDYKAAADPAPFPREWTPDQRNAAYWYALRRNIHVDYHDDLPDQGASAWHGVAQAMNRDAQLQHGRRDAIFAGASDGQIPLPPTEPEPVHVPDPGEPRHPRDDQDDDSDAIGGW